MVVLGEFAEQLPFLLSSISSSPFFSSISLFFFRRLLDFALLSGVSYEVEVPVILSKGRFLEDFAYSSTSSGLLIVTTVFWPRFWLFERYCWSFVVFDDSFLSSWSLLLPPLPTKLERVFYVEGLKEEPKFSFPCFAS